VTRPQPKLLDLPERVDARGALMFAQQGHHVPFPVQRLFAIYNVAEGSSRGGHAHRAQHQLLMMVAGKVTITIDDGVTSSRVLLDRPNLALYVPPMLWLELDDFSQDAVCVVLVSDVYSEADYIRDRDEFLRLSGEVK
jgi:dTDP-4-dehydrorhamnose 3,5-epimerase-like enzyme